MIKKINSKIKKLSFVKFQVIKLIILNIYILFLVIFKEELNSIFTLLMALYVFFNLYGSNICKRSKLEALRELPWIVAEVLCVVIVVYLTYKYT